MEKPLQSFDVCIVCALPEEARAVLAVVQQQCKDAPKEHVSPRYQFSYRSATLRNQKGELLSLHISWLPRYGPQEMTLHLERVLEECQPRIAIMTGICAGDEQQVQLGDLVVAERTFTYDNGKFTLDEQGRSIHLHDALIYQLDANILQFLRLFDEWKPFVADLKRPPSSHEQRTIACHIKAMASGNAVRADHPFEEVQVPVRGTIAIDMEGAAFGLVMIRHPMIRWLVIKGICNYADQTKNDIYHDYAARASALYALSFIRAYVTNERLPRLDAPITNTRAGPSRIWNVPQRRNPHFTGREELLTQLHDHLATSQTAALTQPQAISGLGGIGKTQIALEYAYRYRKDYHFVFWTSAATHERLLADFVTIADILQLPERHEQDQMKVLAAVKKWLATHQQWLLILDNADDVVMVRDFVPAENQGHLVLTTRAQAFGSLAQRIEIEKMGMAEGTLFLLRRATILAPGGSLQQASEEHLAGAEAIIIEMDFLPLALDQAGAYIEETGCSLSAYLDLYRVRRKELLQRRSHLPTDHPESVATTWSLSFQKVEQANPAAADLLRLCAFLEADAIPEDMITEECTAPGSILQCVARDAVLLNEAIEELRKFSLVQRYSERGTLSIHRLVQVVLRDAMDRKNQQAWAEQAIKATNAVFPEKVEMQTWPRCRRYLPQAQSCTFLIRDYALTHEAAASLLFRTALYLDTHTLYDQAEQLYLQALHIWEQSPGSEYPCVVPSPAGLTNRENLAEMYKEFREHDKYSIWDEPLYPQALYMWKQAPESGHPQVVYPLTSLAHIYVEQGKYIQAEQLYLQALQIWERVLGSKHPDLAYPLSGLANMYARQEKYAQAELLYQRALHVQTQTLGSKHPYLNYLLMGLANIYTEQKKYAQAEPLYLQALHIWEQVQEPEHFALAYVLTSLAGMYRVQGNYTQAEAFYVQSLHIWEQIQIPEHPKHLHPAYSLLGLAEIYAEQKKYTQAKPLYLQALHIRKQALGSQHPLTLQTQENTTTFLENMKHRRYTNRAFAVTSLILGIYLINYHLSPIHVALGIIFTLIGVTWSVLCLVPEDKVEKVVPFLWNKQGMRYLPKSKRPLKGFNEDS